jgi:Queuosine salvage protein
VSGDVLDRVRDACARVAEQARSVRIDARRLEGFAATLADAPAPAPGLDPAHHHLADEASTLAYVLTLDAINFGSGWFPLLHKRPGLSGYFTIATCLKERFEREGPWDAEALGALGAADCARALDQDASGPELAELMALYARALNDLGRFLAERFGGRFEGPVEAAGGRAARLVELLAEMPLYRDVARYGALEVPLYKRAQLTAADLSAAFAGRGPGRFVDEGRLTIFADNLVPHVLRCEGVLVYADALARAIDAGELVPAGSPDEVEIRALAVHAVERCVGWLRARGGRATAREIDYLLWSRGQRPELKARPRHRTRTPYY